MPELDEELAEIPRTYARTISAGDAAGMAALFADDAVILAQDNDPLVGKEAVRAFYDGITGRLKLNVTFEPLETERFSETRGMVRCRSGGPARMVDSGEDQILSQQQIFLLRREASGPWLITHYIFNARPLSG